MEESVWDDLARQAHEVYRANLPVMGWGSSTCWDELPHDIRKAWAAQAREVWCMALESVEQSRCA